MKKIGIGILAIVLLLVVAAVMSRGTKKASSVDSKTATIEKGTLLSQVIETGSLDAETSVEVKSKVSGRVAKLLVDEGDKVSAGQLIAEIDPEESQFRVGQDEARLKGAQAQVDRLAVEIEQRKATTKTNLERASSQVEQLKLELDAQPTLTRVNIEAAETAYNNAVKARDLLQKVTQPNQRTAAQSNLTEAQSNYENASAEHDRSVKLLAKGYISQRQFDNSENQLELAKARLATVKDQLDRLDSQQRLELEQAQESVKSAKAGLDKAVANSFQDKSKQEAYQQALANKLDAQTAMLDVNALEATMVQNKATVQQLQDTLNDSKRLLRETQIRSPIDGIVTRRFVQIGELVASLSSFSSGTPIFRVEDRSKMLVKLQINEIDVAKLKLGMKAKINVDAFPDKEYTGEVSKIAPTSVGATTSQQPQTAAAAVVKYEVEIAMDPTDDPLKSGMSAKCTMTVLDRKDVVMLPRQFVGKDDDGKYYVMLSPTDPKDSNAKSKKQEVTVGDTSATSMEILSGAKLGAKVERPE
ncbi:MAG TPA: efflux RND transporter periplasmic adaptor subunit, partial [Fimbriimonadaceae bacterium]|nr:efflux RND transporter periplasmic adaptor subunit [Fimbriimonadaceae bacterium]